MHKGNDESNGAEYFLAALLAESSPLRVAEESIRYKVKALWSLLRPLEQNDDSSQLGALSAFVERLDSQDIVDRARPLRALPSNAGVHGQQQGDAHVMALLCQVLLTACFPRLWGERFHSLLEAGQADFCAQRIFLALAGGALAAGQGDADRLLRYAQLARGIFSNSAYIANMFWRHRELTGKLSVAERSLGQRFCAMPFRNITSVYNNGEYGIVPCSCPGQLPFPLGKGADAWNSFPAQEIRRSILDGDYSYCDKDNCYHIRKGTLPLIDEVNDPELRDIINNRRLVVPHGPSRLTLAHDHSCNLSCPSCRKKVFVCSKSLSDRHDIFFHKQLLPMLDEHLYSMTLGNVGEAFFSPHNIRVLRSLTHERFPHLNLYVLTNGSLVTPRTWAKLGEGGEKIRAISVSIDGATPEVYEKLRVPAKWRVLCRNMEFVGRMRREERLDMFRIQCIVQRDNVCDLAKLYDKAVEWGVDHLVFAQLRNWGAFTPEQFRQMDVAAPDHPLHEKAVSILNELQGRASAGGTSVHVAL